MPKETKAKYIPAITEDYDFLELKKNATRYLAGKSIDTEEKLKLRDAFRALYEYDANEELTLSIERLKELKQLAVTNNEFAAAVSCEKTMAIIFRDKLKSDTTTASFGNGDASNDSSRHLKSLYPHLSNPEEIAKAAAYELGKIRAASK